MTTARAPAPCVDGSDEEEEGQEEEGEEEGAQAEEVAHLGRVAPDAGTVQSSRRLWLPCDRRDGQGSCPPDVPPPRAGV